MPTGYTADIVKGIDFNTFIMNCTRAMGVCITMRDEPTDVKIPDEFKASDYSTKELDKAKYELDILLKLTQQELEDKSRQSFESEVEIHNRRVLEMSKQRGKYNKMLESVHSWIPPTKDHEGLKEFMIKQITESIDWDCDTDYYKKNMPKLLEGREWLSKKVADCNRDIEYHLKNQAEEEKRVRGKNLWLKQLRDSLSNE